MKKPTLIALGLVSALAAMNAQEALAESYNRASLSFNNTGYWFNEAAKDQWEWGNFWVSGFFRCMTCVKKCNCLILLNGN